MPYEEQHFKFILFFIFSQVLGIFMFASGIAVLVNQKDHAALSSVPFQSAAVVILIAGILSIIAGSVEVIAMKCRECPPAEAKKYLLIVSNWEASCWFVKLRISIPSQIVNNV